MKKYRPLIIGSCVMALIIGTYTNVYAQTHSVPKPLAGKVCAISTTKQKPFDSANKFRAFYIDDGYRGPGVFTKRHTAQHFFNSQAVAYNGKTLGQIDDILVNPSGKAQYAIIRDDGFDNLLGDYAVLDYTSIVREERNGDSLIPVEEDALRLAREYNPHNHNDQVNNQIHTGQLISLKNMMRQSISVQNSRVLTKINDITLRGGVVTYAILGVQKTAGGQNRQAAVRFDHVRWAAAENDRRVQLTELQSERLTKIAYLPTVKKGAKKCG